jgi:hypothetical protein
MSAPARKRLSFSRLVPPVVVLLFLTASAVAYYQTSGFLDADGTWYGPTRITSGGVTVSVETYLNISTSLAGQLTGKGTFCLPLPFHQTATVNFSLSGQHAFMLWGLGPQPSIMLSVEETVPVLLGISLPIGPRLQLHGNATRTSLHLIGGDRNTAASLGLKHGTEAAFMIACQTLAPLG